MDKKLFRDDRCYRPDEVAKILGYSLNTIYRMINNIEDPLPAFRPNGRGGGVRMKGTDLNKRVENNKINPVEE